MSEMKTWLSDGSSLPSHDDASDAALHGHVVQFYAEDASLLDALSPFVGAAIAAGDSAIVIATKTHRIGLATLLAARGLDMNAAANQGRYVALDAEETLSRFMLEGWPDQALFAAVIGDVVTRARASAKSKSPRVVAFGEMVSLLWAQGKCEAALQLEQLWCEFIKTDPILLRCAYPLTGFDREEHAALFARICAGHTAVIPTEGYTALASDEDRARNIAKLEQRANALEVEVAERKRMEQALRQAHEEMEMRVRERTVELSEKNRQIEEQSAALEITNQGLRELSARLLRVQDEERRRIARDLHDSTGQALALLTMNLSGLESEIDAKNPELAKRIADNVAIVRQVSSELRTLSYLLHPPLLEEMGLLSALRWYIDGFGKRSCIQVQADLPDDLGRLSTDLELAIFRVVQECLTNVHRHAESATAHIRLNRCAEGIALEVQDRGKGIGRDKLSKIESGGAAGVGLRGMRERIKDLCGKMEIVALEKGTTIRVVFPSASPENIAPGKT